MTQKKRQKIGEGRQTIKHLHEELTAEILSNLAVKSLLRFKSVSKPWRALISSAKFVQSHLNRSNSDPGLTHHTLIANFYDKATGLSVSSCSLKSLIDQDDVVSNWDHTNFRSIRILGSCNGLILIYGYWFHLWNPSTRGFKSISPPSSCPQEYAHLPYNYYVYGFGYDDSTDDYKVVWVISSSVGGHVHVEIHQTLIYSVRTVSWKKIDNFEKGFSPYSYPGKFVNGKLHWLGVKKGVRTIVSLGLEEGEEKYQVVALPEYISNNDQSIRKLENLGGYLGLIGGERTKDTNVWVMIKYGAVESWTNVWTLSDFDLDRHYYYTYATPFMVTENGDVFVLFGKSEVVVYNGKNKLREYRIGEDETLQAEFNHIVYVESLVSI